MVLEIEEILLISEIRKFGELWNFTYVATLIYEHTLY